MKFNSIGCGRLGKNIASALMGAGLQLEGVLNRSYQSSRDAVNFLQAGKAIEGVANLPPADLLWITTADDQIESVVNDICAAGLHLKNTLVVHSSGVLSSTVLLPLKAQGASIASLHPLKAFGGSTFHPSVFQNCDFSLEGDEKAVNYLKELFSGLGANLFSIDTQKKAMYHAAAVIASNYLVTLAYSATKLFEQSGLEFEDAKRITENLISSSLNNLKNNKQHHEALTGPLQRGDIGTIEKHLKAIIDPDILSLYKSAALATLPIVEIDEKTHTALLEIL